jgi:hypothetical protein
LEAIYEEVKSLSETYVRAIETLIGKAATLLEFAVAIIGISASLSPLANQLGLIPKILFLIGILMIVISAIFSLLAYKIQEVSFVRANNLSKIDITKISRKEVLQKFIPKYDKCIDDNRRILDSQAKKIKISFWALLVGISLFSASIFIGVFI